MKSCNGRIPLPSPVFPQCGHAPVGRVTLVQQLQNSMALATKKGERGRGRGGGGGGGGGGTHAPWCGKWPAAAHPFLLGSAARPEYCAANQLVVEGSLPGAPGAPCRRADVGACGQRLHPHLGAGLGAAGGWWGGGGGGGGGGRRGGGGGCAGTACLYVWGQRAGLEGAAAPRLRVQAHAHAGSQLQGATCACDRLRSDSGPPPAAPRLPALTPDQTSSCAPPRAPPAGAGRQRGPQGPAVLRSASARRSQGRAGPPPNDHAAGRFVRRWPPTSCIPGPKRFV